MGENCELTSLISELITKTEAYATGSCTSVKGEWSDCIIVSKLIKSLFIDVDLGYDWDNEELITFYQEQLIVLTTFIERILPTFGQEGIYWVISAYTKFLSYGCPTNLSETLLEKIRRLYYLLGSECQKSLLGGCITAWITYKCNKNATVTINPNQKILYELNEFDQVSMSEIPIVVNENGEAGFAQCMVYIIKASIAEIRHIPDKRGLLWMILIRESDDIYSALKTLPIMNYLVKERNVDSYSFLNYVDIIISYFRFFVENPLDVNEIVKSNIEKRIIEGIKMICSIISDLNSAIMKKIQLGSFLQFASDLARIIIKRPHAYCAVFMKFINAYLMSLNGKQVDKSLYKDFARKCVDLIKIMIMKTEQIDDRYVKNVFDFFRKIEGPEKTTIIVVNILKDIEKGSSTELSYRLRKVIKNLSNDIITKAVSKLLNVLKLIISNEEAVEVWTTFLESIDKKIIQENLSQILITVAGLYGKPDCESVFKPLFEARIDSDGNSVSCKRFDRAVFVFYGQDREFMNQFSIKRFDRSELMTKGIEMLLEEGPDAQKYVLDKLFVIIDDMEDYDQVRQLINALLYALKTAVCEDTQQLIGACLGKLGAIDPGLMGMQAVGDNRKCVDRRHTNELKLITNPSSFFQNTLTLCAKILIDCNDAEKANYIGYSIQVILKELDSPVYKAIKKKVLQSLKNDIFREIEPYNGAPMIMPMSEKPKVNVKPFVNDSKSYSEWLWKWFFSASTKIKDMQFSRIFKGLQFVYYADDIRLPQEMIPQLIIQSMVEDNNEVRDEALNEICAVFDSALATNDGWIRLASHTCFQIIELLEKFYISMDGDKRKPPYKVIVGDFLKFAIGKKLDENNLLSVAVAMKYNSSCRALRWLEQYGIRTKNNVVEFERDLMYLLERIYTQLNDTDGVLGAFETIKSHATPLPKEHVVALEATGDYTRALPLYQSPRLQKVPLVKCFMRMNQPLVAYNNAKIFVQNEVGYVSNKLHDYQIEGAYKTGDWGFLNEKLKNVEQININSWGAHVAAILSQVHEKSYPTFEICMKRARKQLMESLQAVTMEDTDTYSQAYRYIQRLHILYEIEDACGNFSLFSNETSETMTEFVLSTWTARSEHVIQCSGVLEPIYETRRNILKLVNPEIHRDSICSYLLESCRLSIQAGHLETAWTHLVEARCLNVEYDLEIDIETARYEFERGEQYTAISTLRKSLKKHFPNLMDEMDKAKRAETMNKSYLESKGIKNVKLYENEENKKEDFVKGTLVLTEFLGKANGANLSEIYDIFKFVYDFEGNNLTETLAYRFAVFYDKSYHSRDPSNLDSAVFVMKLYSKVLDSGKRYMLHAIARLLTIWQDFTALPIHLAAERKYLEKSKRRTSTKEEKIGNKIMSDTMSMIFNQKDNYIFFSAFPQLVSSICHESDLTFDLLRKMIVELMKEYPHECLWQIISSYRSRMSDRAEKTRRIFSLLYREAPEMNFQELVRQYDFIASKLINVAENKNIKSGTHRDFNRIFPAFSEFFKREKCKVSVPFITMVEKKMPTFLASQFVIPDQTENAIFITGFEDDFVTFTSLEKPKKVTMIGSNNLRYALITKQNDELRKDARCLDFCRTVNTLLLRDSEARRRQLHIRTYCVIPLQEQGGIIEFIPNLIHMRQAVQGSNSSHLHSEWNKIKQDPKARRRYFQKLCDDNPVVMAEYLRNSFPDPCKWYGARLAFTRTTATMSMVGFILGLGDRHCENILIDSTNGELCHVDFNVLFNMGDDLPVPEKVPFRLTRNIVDGFGPTGVEGCFKKSCEVVIRLLREEQDMLCTVLQTFIHDPLLEFNKIEQRNQQMRQTKSNLQSDGTEIKSRLEIDLIKSRLEGNIVTRKVYPLTKSIVPMSVEGQVAQLIKMATDFNTLADMFIGWNPHL